MVGGNRTLGDTHHIPYTQLLLAGIIIQDKDKNRLPNSQILNNSYYPLFWIGQTWDIHETLNEGKPHRQVVP